MQVTHHQKNITPIKVEVVCGSYMGMFSTHLDSLGIQVVSSNLNVLICSGDIIFYSVITTLSI